MRPSMRCWKPVSIDKDIDILHGDEDIQRLDPTGEEHGFLAQFQRTLLRLAGPAEEYTHLRHHVEDVRRADS